VCSSNDIEESVEEHMWAAVMIIACVHKGGAMKRQGGSIDPPVF